MTVSRTRHDPSARAASWRARISACAVGSWRRSRSFLPAPTTSPPRATTAPTGTSSCSKQRSASASARPISSSSAEVKVPDTRVILAKPPPGGACSFSVRRVLLLSLLLIAACPAAASAAHYRPGQVVLHDDLGTRVVPTPGDHSVLWTAGRLRDRQDVDWAVPNYVAHAVQASFVPNDPGDGSGWQAMQWNFLPGTGVNAPGAWENLISDGKPGGKGVVVAVLDSGVAYENRGRYRRSP